MTGCDLTRQAQNALRARLRRVAVVMPGVAVLNVYKHLFFHRKSPFLSCSEAMKNLVLLIFYNTTVIRLSSTRFI